MLVEEHCDNYSEESRNLRHLLCFPFIPFRVERLRMSHAPVTFEWRGIPSIGLACLGPTGSPPNLAGAHSSLGAYRRVIAGVLAAKQRRR